MEKIKPLHVVLFMLTCLAVLAAISLVCPKELSLGDNLVRFPQLSEVLHLNNDSAEEVATPVVLDSTLNAVAPTPNEESVDTTDTRLYLSAFYKALTEASTRSVRVVHYGDSQIEEDRITAQVRRRLHQRYGGGGVGLIPLHQTIPTRTIWQKISMNGQYQSINQGPMRYLVYGPKSMRRANRRYGSMGQVAIMDNTLVEGSEDIILEINGTGNSKNTESYFNRLRIFQRGDITVSVNHAIDHQNEFFLLPDSTTSVSVHLVGQGEVYGISLEQDHGVMADNIPMRGCDGAVFTAIDSAELSSYFRATNTRLIILQYGGNIMPFTTTRKQVEQYIHQMRAQIRYIRQTAPESSILFVGPSDMSERRDGQLQTYAMIPVMDEALLQLAKEERIAYYSMYQHMGGRNSMISWQEKGLAGGDYVHFTRKGADKAGDMLAEWLIE